MTGILYFLSAYSLTIVLCVGFDYNIPPYGTKNAYYTSFTEEEADLLENPASYVPDVCHPIHVSVTSRHGSRYPADTDMTYFTDLVNRVRGNIHNPDFAILNDTDIKFDFEDANMLA